MTGKYVANHGKGFDDAIELKQDGSYMYTYRSHRGSEFHNFGRWTFREDDGQPRVTFDDFTFGLQEYGGPRRGYWDVAVETSWAGHLRLPLDRDLGYYYLKQ